MSYLSGFPDVYNTNLLDTTVGLHWPQMTNAQRLASATNWGRVVWDGGGVTAAVPDVLTLGSPNVEVNSPASIAGVYQFGTASFGPAHRQPERVRQRRRGGRHRGRRESPAPRPPMGVRRSRTPARSPARSR